jgi:hypothetical protein
VSPPAQIFEIPALSAREYRRAVIRCQRTTMTNLLLMPASARAAHSRLPPSLYDVEISAAGLDSRIAPVEAEQASPPWCWAACVSAILHMHGHELAQRRVVAETYGRAPGPAWGRDVADATTRRWLTDDFRWLTCKCVVLYDGDPKVERVDLATEAERELADGSALILGAGDHVMLLTEITVARDASGNGQPLAAIVRDPLPGKGRRPLKPQEWTGARFLAKLLTRADDRGGW